MGIPVQRRDMGYIGGKVLGMELPGRRKRGMKARDAKEETYGCCEGGYGGGWGDRGGCGRQGEVEWRDRTPNGISQRRKRKKIFIIFTAVSVPI